MQKDNNACRPRTKSLFSVIGRGRFISVDRGSSLDKGQRAQGDMIRGPGAHEFTVDRIYCGHHMPSPGYRQWSHSRRSFKVGELNQDRLSINRVPDIDYTDRDV